MAAPTKHLAGYLVALTVGAAGGASVTPTDPLGGWHQGDVVKIALAAPAGGAARVEAGGYVVTRSGVEVAWEEFTASSDEARACHAEAAGPGGPYVAWYRVSGVWMREVNAVREPVDPPPCALALARRTLGVSGAAAQGGPDGGGR